MLKYYQKPLSKSLILEIVMQSPIYSSAIETNHINTKYYRQLWINEKVSYQTFEVLMNEFGERPVTYET